jgi:ABC-2 type transport system ATP-binding protein
MQEVQAICNRVIIINKGKLVADDSIESLQKNKSNQIVIKVSFKESVNQSEIEKIDGVIRAEKTETLAWKIICTKPLQEQLFQFAVQHQKTITSLNQETESLENIFRTLTQNK